MFFTGFRARLFLTVIALVAGTAFIVAAVGYVLVERSLRAQLVDDAVGRAEFNIGVLATEDVLPRGAGRVEFEASGLPTRFLLRGTTGVFVEFPAEDDPYVSSLALVDVATLVDARLRDLVASGQLGYQFIDLGEDPSLVVAGRRPGGGPDFYFVSSAAPVDRALDQLRQVLAGVGLAVTLLGALVAGLVARGVLRPVRQAAAGAHRMATGDLTVRLPEAPGDDAFARWTASFNAMAAALEQKISELEEARLREQRFVADVSHELRTPLTALVNEAAMAARHLATMPGEPQRLGELLVADVARLRTLVEDLLEISRLEAAPAVADPTDTDLVRLVSAIVAERHPDAGLRFSGPDRVMTDRRGLERILGNLLDNAHRHAPGATVQVDVAVGAGERQLTISVSDDGPGIPGDDLSRIFDRLTMIDTARQGGSGLGLAIARQHALRLGGTLTARNRTGGGSVFELRLPVTGLLPGGDGDATLQMNDGVTQ